MPITVDINNYDEIIIGTPTWWYRPTPAIRSFLSQVDLSTKTVIPFATNAGWLGRTLIEIKSLCMGKVEKEMNIVFDSEKLGKLVTSEEEIEEWINNI